MPLQRSNEQQHHNDEGDAVVFRSRRCSLGDHTLLATRNVTHHWVIVEEGTGVR